VLPREDQAFGCGMRRARRPGGPVLRPAVSMLCAAKELRPTAYMPASGHQLHCALQYSGKSPTAVRLRRSHGGSCCADQVAGGRACSSNARRRTSVLGPS
jgi:hypothetical protein